MRHVTATPAFPLAPPGWGFHPGTPLALEPVPVELAPDLPLLKLLPRHRRRDVLVQALRQFPGLPFVTATEVVRRYNVSQSMATAALECARGARC